MDKSITPEMIDLAFEKLANSDEGKIFREFFEDLRAGIKDIDKVRPEVYFGDSTRLASELVGRKIASDYIANILTRLQVKEDKEPKKKTHI